MRPGLLLVGGSRSGASLRRRAGAGRRACKRRWLDRATCRSGSPTVRSPPSRRRGVALMVPAGESAAFLADLPIGTLTAFGDSALVDVLRRLGIWTLGGFAALPARDVAARFGPAGAWAHRQAGGRDDRPVVVREPPLDCSVTVELETPVDRVDVVAFSAREVLPRRSSPTSSARALACACFELEVFSEAGERAARRWRASGVLTASDVIDRIRWQIEGWLHGGDERSRRRDRAGSPGCGSSRSRRCRAALISRRCGAATARPASGPTGRWPGCRRCSASTAVVAAGGGRRPRSGAAHPARAMGGRTRSRHGEPTSRGQVGCRRRRRRW